MYIPKYGAPTPKKVIFMAQSGRKIFKPAPNHMKQAMKLAITISENHHLDVVDSFF